MTRCLFGIMMVLMFTIGCETRQVKYVDVPSWQLREGVVSERYIDSDGVLVINRPRKMSGVTDIGKDGRGADSGRIENETGEVTLQAILPDQVVSHVVQCLFDEEYELLWDQLLSDKTKQQYEEAGQGKQEFIDFLRANRNELYSAMNRMLIGIRSPEVIREAGPHGGTRLRFHPHFADSFEFVAIDTVFENMQMKLLMIHPRIPLEEGS